MLPSTNQYGALKKSELKNYISAGVETLLTKLSLAIAKIQIVKVPDLEGGNSLLWKKLIERCQYFCVEPSPAEEKQEDGKPPALTLKPTPKIGKQEAQRLFEEVQKSVAEGGNDIALIKTCLCFSWLLDAGHQKTLKGLAEKANLSLNEDPAGERDSTATPSKASSSGGGKAGSAKKTAKPTGAAAMMGKLFKRKAKDA